MKITTKTGDKGQTGLFGGKRVSKADNFINLLGELDELQAFIGFAKCSIKDKKKVEVLTKVEDDLYRLMSIVGFEFKIPKNTKTFDEEDVAFLEKEIEAHQGEVGNLNKFVRPGINESSARIHLARSVCRRVERSFVKFLDEKNALSSSAFKYLNRLSDLLFIYAYLITGSRK